MPEGPLRLMRRLPPAVRLLVAGTFVNRVGTMIVPYLSVSVFVPLLLLFGFVSDLYRPAATAMLGDLLPSSARALGFAALRAAVNLGETRPAAASAPAAAGSGMEAAISPWRDGVFMEVAAASFVSCLVLVSFATVLLSAPQAGAFVADWAPPAARGRYMAVFQATFSLAVALNPLVFLPLHARLGEARFWPLVGLLGLPAAALTLHLDRTADRPQRLRGLNAEARPAVSS